MLCSDMLESVDEYSAPPVLQAVSSGAAVHDQPETTVETEVRGVEWFTGHDEWMFESN